MELKGAAHGRQLEAEARRLSGARCNRHRSDCLCQTDVLRSTPVQLRLQCRRRMHSPTAIAAGTVASSWTEARVVDKAA